MATQIWATSQILGYRPQALGFGVVTITKHAPGVPPITRLPAWVGFATVSGIAFSCPSMVLRPHAPAIVPPVSAGDAAVVVGVARGSPAVVYKARSAPCDTLLPSSLTRASEAFSIPWVPLGPITGELLRVEAVLPVCGSYAGTASGGSAAAMTVTLYAVVPEGEPGSHCGGGRVVSETILLGPGPVPGAPPPLVSPSTSILHGATGPERVVDASAPPPGGSGPVGVAHPDGSPGGKG